MIALALRSLGQRKLRTALTAIAVLLGVAMIAGTYVQTDRISGAFESLMRTGNRGTDVVVSPRQAFTASPGAPSQGLGEALLARVRAVPGVRRICDFAFRLAQDRRRADPHRRTKACTWVRPWG